MSGSRALAGVSVGRVVAVAVALTTGLCAGPPPASGMGDEPASREQLDRLRGHIEQLGRRLERDRQTYDGVMGELRETELRIARTAKLLAQTEAAISARRRELQGLEGDRARIEASIREGRRRLANQIRLGYVLGRQDRLLLMLNQQDPATLARALTYHDYFSRALARAIGEQADRREALRSAGERIADATADLEALHRRQSVTGQRLRRERAERARTASRLRTEIADDSERLVRLREDERRLEALLRELETTSRELPIPDDDRPAFARLKGRLPWPTEGAVRDARGAADGDSSWQGVVIAAPTGASVRAVSHGRVAFAEWLRGFGLLVIVDHGEGYMSLYGRNEVLLKEVGEWVEAGEPIARVGASGGAEEPGLYFEIRDRGSPRNPRAWCSASHTPSATLVRPRERPVCFASLLAASPGEVHECCIS